jgi:antitoxin component YwqK of YwqJK toxin-antitoxin module
MFGQKTIHRTDSAGFLVIDKIVGIDTFFVYPYYFDNVYYQHIDIDSTIPDGMYNAYLNDSVTLLLRIRYINFRPDGVLNCFYKSGKIKSRHSYKKGVEEGPYNYYNENGDITEQGQYKNGKADGDLFEYWDNGKIKKSTRSLMGTLTGSYKYYYSNGQIDTDGRYDALGEPSNYFTGYFVGTWTFYYENGRIKEVRHYIDSIGPKEKKHIAEYEKEKHARPEFPIDTAFTFNQNGSKTTEYIYKNYQLIKSTKYYPNGKAKEIINYTDFHQGFCSQNPSFYIKGGQFNEYYENGSKKTEGNYSNNEKEGEWFSWSDTGQLTKKEIYKKGKIKK